MSPGASQTVEVAGRSLTVSNLDKVLYPATGFTKAAVIDYYVRVAPVLLRHLAGRPLTMLRYPDGVDGGRFFEKRCPDHRPEWLSTVDLGREGKDKVVAHCDIRDTAGLVWVANLASLELHTSLARGPDTFTPTMVVFDLDPGPPAGMLACAQVALWCKEVFDRLGLVSAVKTSGSKGLQVYVPVNRPTSYEATREFALSVGRLLERVHGELVVTNMSKDLRDRQGARRLEPEPPHEDDGVHLLAACPRAPHRVDPRDLGGGRGRRRGAGSGPARLRRAHRPRADRHAR